MSGVELIGPVDAKAMTDWIASIPFEDWPQQNKRGEELKPAMVTDVTWHGFGPFAYHVIDQIMPTFPADARYMQAMLSVVMPGHNIPPHVDHQADYWITRVHVPLATNSQSDFVVEGVPHHMECGKAYRVNTRLVHGVLNNGFTPRVHFMFDVRQ